MRPPVQIPWPLSSAPGARPQESAGRLIGCYAEPIQAESGPAQVVWRKSPGITHFATSGQTGYRGGIHVESLVFIAMSGKLITVTATGVVTLVGTLSGDKRVTFARNNLTPTPDIACVTENGAFVVTSGSITSWPDADLPQPNSVAFQDGYFFFSIGDRRAFASDLNSTAVNSQSFVTIQSRSSDALLRAIPFNGMMFFFCSSSTEIYQDTANPTPAFPYTRVSVFDRGLIGANAIAGWEDGFGQLLWAADDFGVYKASGFQPQKVSPPDLDRLIKAADPTLLEASCYVHAGHSFWVLSSPDWTWEFNLNTQKWNERWTNTTGLITTRSRMTGGLLAFGKWLMGSIVTGNIVYTDDTAFTEEGDPLVWRMESGPVQQFPNRVRVGRADFDFVTGVGIPGGSANDQNPTVSISWSDDGGVTWGNPVLRSLGAGQNSKVRVSITGCGQSGPQGRRWRIDVADGVYVSFMGATMSANPRAN